MLLVSPERLNNPGFRDEVLPRLAATAGCSWSTRPTASPTGATTSGPTTAGSARCSPTCPTGIPVLATTATANARVTADVAEQLATGDGDDVLVLRGSLDRESLRLGGASGCRPPEQRLAWLGRPPRRAAAARGIVYCLTVAATQEIAELPARARPRRRGVLRADRGRPSGSPSSRTCSPAGSRRWSRPARSGMGFDATLGFVVNLGAPAVAGRLLPAGRPRRARHRPRRRWSCCPQPEDRDIWAYFASLAFPPRGAGARTRCGCWPSEGRRCQHRRAGDLRRPGRTRLETMLKVLDVDGAVRRVRGGWDGDRRRSGPTTPSATTGSPRPARASRRRCSTTSTPTGCRMWFLRDQLDDPERRRDCGRCDNCGGLDAARRGLRRPRSTRPRDRLARPGRRRRAAQDVAHRAGQPRPRPQGPDRRRRRAGAGPSPGSPTSATGRRCASCSARAAADGPVPDAAGAAP